MCIFCQNAAAHGQSAHASDDFAFELSETVFAPGEGGYNRGQRPDVIDTGDAEVDGLIDGLLMNSIYTAGTQLTYTFELPAGLASDDTYSVFSEAMIARHLQVFQHITDLTGVAFVEVDPSGDVDMFFANANNTATAYVQGYSGGVLHVHSPVRNSPVPGGYTDHLVIHELGHGLALRHGHGEGNLPAAYQGHEWSVMSYKAHPDTENLYFADSHGPTTFMLADIAAIQFQFGANYAAYAGDTTYTVDFATGELMVDGVSDYVPINNKMLRAVWDGNGVDTMDLSNAGQGVSIDLRPGEFVSLGANRQAYLGSDPNGVALYAQGNIGMSYLYQGDTRSLIENGVGSAYADVLNGNDVNNRLVAAEGADQLAGFAGDDWLEPGEGEDTVDGGAGTDMVSFFDAISRMDADLGAGVATVGSDTNTLISIEGITATSFGDYIVGSDANNRIRGLGDYDWFVGSAGADYYDGGSGRDMVSYVGADSGVTLDLGAGRGTGGQAAGDRYVSVERVTGSVHSDTITGSAGEDDFRGLGGFDWFVGSAGGRDRYDGGSGRDTVSYANSTSGVTASLSLDRGSSGDAARDLYTSIENLTGSNHNDVLTGDAGRNILRGQYGNDQLFGGAGNDRITGGGSNDYIDGGAGWDVAIFSYDKSEYTISTSGLRTTVTYDRTGRDGIDTVVNVEALIFADDIVYL